MALAPIIAALAGCASGPEKHKNQAYEAYWQCARGAVRPYIAESRMDPREAALRAVAHCDADYQQFRRAQIALVGDKLNADSADLATALGTRQAQLSRTRVRRALAREVRRARRR